jgi:hypothetical protein
MVGGFLFAAAVTVLVAPHHLEARQEQAPGARLDTSYGCIVCHADKRRTFTLGIHSERGIRCHACHGGNPAALETPAAHRGSFIGNPDKLATVRICSACHSDPAQMRQFGLHTDQVAELRTSRHGQLLLGQSNMDAPTCTNCHDAHTILPPEDARSNVHPTNIPATCAGCHDDEQLMEKYGLPTRQFEEYRASTHGVSLFEEQNFAAPTCIGCHGSHTALPPGVTEVVNVCDHCHVLVGRAFNMGPHAEAARSGELPGCLGCHSNHGTERVPPDELAASCTPCHEVESAAALMGVEIQEQVTRAVADLQLARHAIDELEVTGHQVADARFRYQAALTDYLQMARVQHQLDLEQLQDLALRVGSISREIRTTAEVRLEERWEHKLWLIPIWFLGSAGVLFAWFMLRSLRRRTA